MNSAIGYLLTAGKWVLALSLLAIVLTLVFCVGLYVVIISQDLAARRARARFMRGIALHPRPAVYLKREDVQLIRNYMHYIPMGRGWSQRLITENYPGWDWGAMVTYLTSCGALKTGDRGITPGQGWDGVLLDGSGGCVFDEGGLEHPMKDAWVAPRRPDTSITPTRPVAAIDLATGLDVPLTPNTRTPRRHVLRTFPVGRRRRFTGNPSDVS